MNNETIKNNIWKAGLAVGVLLAIFLAVLVIKELKSIPYVGKNIPIMNTITVNGKGETISIPDIATFYFGVTEKAKSVDEAQAKATAKVNTAIKALKDNRIEEKDIKTTSYNINPSYEYNPTTGKSVLMGYEVSQTTMVKVRDLKKAGSLFATIGALDVQNVNGLTFSIDDIDTVRGEARDLAIADAQDKAKILAKQLGVSLVRITGFYDQGNEPFYFNREGMGGDMMSIKAAAPQAPEILPGEQKVVSNISITYEIR